MTIDPKKFDEKIAEAVKKIQSNVISKEKKKLAFIRDTLIEKNKKEKGSEFINEILTTIHKIADKETVNVETKEIVFPEIQKVSLEKTEIPLSINNFQDIPFPEIQKVTGDINVTFPEVQKVSGEVFVKFPAIQSIKGDVGINNFPKIQDVKVTNLPETIKISNFPDVSKVKITNLPESIEISKLPLAEGANASKKADPTKYLPVRLTNGKEFINALASKVASVGGGGGSVVPFINADGTKGFAKLNSAGALMVDTTENGIPAHDYQSLSYDVNDNLETITFKSGGSSGTTVATMTLGYDGSDNLISITTTL